MANPGAYLTAQCVNEECRLRFPATAAELHGLHCPRCGQPLSSTPRPTATVASARQAWASENLPGDARLCGLLDNIRSIHNTGSIFRTADGAGFSHLYLCGYTATPEQPRLARAALGAEQSVSWSSHANALDLVSQLKDDGCFIIALERGLQTDRQAMLFETGQMVATQPVTLVVGNEKAGVDPDLLAYCDRVVALPMAGQKSSLNVAVAFGIAAYQLRFGRASAA